MFSFGRRAVERLEFIVAGAQKSGTTALNYYLKRHPRIALPTKKELHFFDNDELFARDRIDYGELHKYFPPVRPGSVAGENTPNYLYWPRAMARIYAYNPAIKLIILLRNPIERAFSQWNMQRVRGIEALDFVDALRAEPNRLATLPPTQLRKFAYADRGRYGEQLERAFALFPREQFLVLRYEEFRGRQRDLVDQVFQFLQLKPVPFRPVEAHDIPYQRNIRPDERAFVSQLLRGDIDRLESMLGWDCVAWRR